MINLFLGFKFSPETYIFSGIIIGELVILIAILLFKNLEREIEEKKKKKALEKIKFVNITFLDRVLLGKHPVQTVYLDRNMNYSGTEYLPEPKKEPSEGKVYKFLGWDKNALDEHGKFYIKPIYLETAQKVTVNVYGDAADKPIKTFKIEYGAGINLDGITPERQATPEFTFKFAGWDKDINSFVKNESVYAVFEATPNKYTYKFLNSDGEIINKKTAVYGTPITLPNPQKIAVPDNYEFVGWKNYEDGMILSKDIDFNPVFKKK